MAALDNINQQAYQRVGIVFYLHGQHVSTSIPPNVFQRVELVCNMWDRLWWLSGRAAEGQGSSQRTTTKMVWSIMTRTATRVRPKSVRYSGMPVTYSGSASPSGRGSSLIEDAVAGGESELRARSVVESSRTSSFSMVIEDASDDTVLFVCMTKEWIYLSSVDKNRSAQRRRSLFTYT
jgi:hypothetical protein